MTMLAELLAGLGLLFVGLRLIGQHLSHAAGHRVRGVLRAATTSRWSGMLAGGLAGAITQSSNAVTLITANLVRAHVLSLAQAIPVVAGASAGTALLVFLATFDIHLIVLCLMALCGLALHFKMDGNPQYRDWLWAALGLALLLVSLSFIKAAPAQLAPEYWRLLAGMPGIVALLVGMAVAFVTQSSSTAAIVAVVAQHGGFITFEAAFWLIAGANAGSGLAVLAFDSGFKGSGRQLCLVYVIVKLTGTLAGVAVWFAGAWIAGGTLAAYVAPDRASPILAMVLLAMQLAGVLPVVLLRDAVAAWTKRFTPADPVEQASTPRYIYDRAVEDPLNALKLSELERDRLIAGLPELLPDLEQPEASPPAARRAKWAGYQSVARQTGSFLETLIGRGLGGSDLHRALNGQLMLENLLALQDTFHEFGQIVDGLPETPPLVFSLSESLRTLAMLLADTAGDGEAGADDLDILIEMTGDRGDMMERQRRQLTTAEGGRPVQQLLAATRLFERAVWLIRRLAIARRGMLAQEENEGAARPSEGGAVQAMADGR